MTLPLDLSEARTPRTQSRDFTTYFTAWMLTGLAMPILACSELLGWKPTIRPPGALSTITIKFSFDAESATDYIAAARVETD